MAERYPISQRVLILKNDDDFTNAMLNAGFTLINNPYPLGDTEYANLAEVLLNLNSVIVANTVIDLVASNYLKPEIENAMGFGDAAIDPNRPSSITSPLYDQVFYSYKYSSIRNFFKENYKKFLPDYDIYSIEDSAKKELLAQAYMIELDRFTDIIDNIYNIVDIDKIPEEYLAYLAQIIGYERTDYSLLTTNASFRELLKNIIEIYKIKGTNYSFELFLNFLGFDVDLKEFWFDKRYADDGININTLTGETDKEKYAFYLSETKPTEDIPSSMVFPYCVTEDAITSTQDINQFNVYTDLHTNDSTTGYSAKQLLGDTGGYSGTNYTFFKTNLILYSLTSLGTGQEPELTTDDLIAINNYVEFITPIFIQKQVIVTTRPYSEYAEGMALMEFDRTAPTAASPQGSNLYSGFVVSNITVGDWGDTEGDTYTLATIAIDDSTDVFYSFLLENRVVYINLNTGGDTLEGNYKVDFTYDNINGVISNSAVKDDTDTTITLAQPLWEGGDTTFSGYTISCYRIEPMYLNYETAYPRTSYYGDSLTYGDSWLMTYKDATGDSLYTNVIPNTPYFRYYGHWISGFHTDTQSFIYDRDNSISVFNKLMEGDSTPGHNGTMDTIATLLSKGDTGLFGDSFHVKGRDLIPPFRSLALWGDSQDLPISQDYSIGHPITFGAGFSFDTGALHKRLSEKDSRRRTLPIYYGYGDSIDVGVRVKILSVDVDNGSSQSVLDLYDPNRSFRNFGDSGDTIVLYDMPGDSGDSSEGIYTVASVVSSTVASTIGTVDISSGQYFTVGDTGDSGMCEFIVTTHVAGDSATVVTLDIYGGDSGDSLVSSLNEALLTAGVDNQVEFYLAGDSLGVRTKSKDSTVWFDLDIGTGDSDALARLGLDGDTRWGTGNGDTTVIILTTVLPGVDLGDSGGLLQLYAADWRFNDNTPFMFDRELYVTFTPNYTVILSGTASIESSAREYRKVNGNITVSADTTTLLDGYYYLPEGTINFSGGEYRISRLPSEPPFIYYMET